MKLWQWVLLGLGLGLGLHMALYRPPSVDASTTCATLLQAACERQQGCGSCQTNAVPMPCSAIVAGEVTACVLRAAPGARFSSEAVGSCQRALLGQTCGSACEAPVDPDACLPFAGLAGR